MTAVPTTAMLMNLESLEWHRLVELICQEARSEPAKQLIWDLTELIGWAGSVQEANLMQAETQETQSLLDRDALWGPLLELADCAPILEHLAKGAILELSELTLLRGWLYAIDSWTQIPAEEVRAERFKKALLSLPHPRESLRTIERILSPEGEILEKASAKLALISQEIRSIKREIESTMERLVKAYSSQGILQENFSDLRDGRYVLPVKIGAQHSIEGITYEASASRKTVFFEPREVALLNNQLSQKKNERALEITAILEAASNALRPYVTEIATAIAILTHWDAVQAKARIGRLYSGKLIIVTEQRIFSLRHTAHPLLWWTLPAKDIVRNDLEFGEPTRALLITGPNTGGKTVLLKTLGLAGICARTGLPYPAIDHPKVPFFDSFFVDMGDSQSLEDHISSFAGHILRFRNILNELTPLSLILLDELNSATDPEEGAALGRAILETLMDRKAMIVSTTHDPYLKALAVSHPQISVASMAFNDAARTPTFKLVLGVVGRSRALETAARLGIPEEVITRAQGYLSQGHLEFEKMLEGLEKNLADTAQKKRETVALHQEAEKLKAEWSARTEESLRDNLDRVRNRLRRIADQAQDEVRAIVQKLSEKSNKSHVDRDRGELSEKINATVQSLDVAIKEEAPDLVENLPYFSSSKEPNAEIGLTTQDGLSRLKVGMKVRIPKWKTQGVVLEIYGNKIKVAMGNLQVTLNPNEIDLKK